MRYTTAHKRLGLSALDIKIMTALDRAGKGQSYPLALTLSEKRTTVDYRLKRLCQLGWLTAAPFGQRRVYELTLEARELFLAAKQQVSLVHYGTLSEMLVVVRRVVGSRSKGRLYFIEPSGIAEATLSAMGSEYAGLQAFIKKSGRVAEGVIGQSAVTKLPREVWQVLQGRLFEMYEVADDRLAFCDIIWVADDTTFLLNPSESRYRSLQDHSFANSMRALIQALILFGKKINPHQRHLA